MGSSLSPSSNVNTNVNPYQFGNQQGADVGAFQGIGGLGQYNTYGPNLGQFGKISGQLGVNNPYAGQLQQGANQAGGLMQGAGLGAYGAGQGLYGLAGNLAGTESALERTAGGQLDNVKALMTLGFDPENALYARTQQQNAQQIAAQNAASGVGSTPYGAGVANLANSNFNIDWQSQALQRALAGAQGAGGLLSNIAGAYGTGANLAQAAGNLAQTGAGLQQGGAGLYAQGAGLPYGTSQGIYGDTLSGLSQLGQYGAAGAGLQNQQIIDYLNYLTGGQAGTKNALGQGQLQLGQAKDIFEEQKGAFGGLGQGLGQLLGLGSAGYGNFLWGSGGPMQKFLGYGGGG